jgi:hypothetical protein
MRSPSPKAGLTVSIVPPGALGVGFAWQLQNSAPKGTWCFRPRCENSSWLASFQHSGQLPLAVSINGTDPAVYNFPLAPSFRTEPGGKRPDCVLFVGNPDQIIPFLRELVTRLESIWRENPDRAFLVEANPKVVLCSNGIYFQRMRQVWIELLEESTLLGRLPDLWPDMMPNLVGRLFRGVTLQTGQRLGSGNDAIYVPGPPGLTRLSGTDRKGCAQLSDQLKKLGLLTEAQNSISPTRLEFDKALVNLTSNLLGQITALRPDGIFRPKRVRDVYCPENAATVQAMTEVIWRTGKSVNAYCEETIDDLSTMLEKITSNHADHIPSGLQTLETSWKDGSLEQGIGSTERWILEPLKKFARSSGREEDVTALKEWERELAYLLEKASGKQAKPQPQADYPRSRL